MSNKNFNSISDLLKHYNSPKGQVDLIEDSSIRASLKEAQNLLHAILYEKVRDYYDSYTPKYYERTYNFLNSIRTTPIIREGNQYTFTVYFDEDMGTHPSIMGGEDGYVPILLEEGWQWKNDTTNKHHFSYYEGFNFVEKAIDEFNLRNKWGLVLKKEIRYKGQYI
jgi:hypothetical protein